MSRRWQRRPREEVMWTARSETVAGRARRFMIESDSSAASFGRVLKAWQDDAGFRAFFLDLAASPYAAFRWETPALTDATIEQPFEFVLWESPGLASRPDPDSFAEHFEAAGDDGIVTFPNLGRSAILVVPAPRGPATVYAHLAAFVRGAPDAQKHALWQHVAHAMQRRLSDRPVWLSTAGAGVSWLHVRLDDRPKYYAYEPYKSSP